jgi:hypothetical protein
MNTDTIRDALPANTEWQDSIMNDGTHRLLGKTANLNVEIIPDTSVRLAFAEVDQSVLSVVGQVAGDQDEALSFLHTAAQYVVEHPNEPYHADYANFHRNHFCRCERKAINGCTARIVPDHSTFRKRKSD